MKTVKEIYGLFFFGLFFLIYVLIMNVVGYAADVAVERPVYSAGDYWNFTRDDGKTTKLEFMREEGGQYIFSRGGHQIVKDFNLTNVNKSGYPGPIIRFPLKKGKWWKYEYRVKSIIPMRHPGRSARYEVEDYEQITVLAGTFWAFKITVTIYNINKTCGPIEYKIMDSATYWYAPDVKQIIRNSEGGKVSELKEYKIK